MEKQILKEIWNLIKQLQKLLQLWYTINLNIKLNKAL